MGNQGTLDAFRIEGLQWSPVKIGGRYRRGSGRGLDAESSASPVAYFRKNSFVSEVKPNPTNTTRSNVAECTVIFQKIFELRIAPVWFLSDAAKARDSVKLPSLHEIKSLDIAERKRIFALAMGEEQCCSTE